MGAGRYPGPVDFGFGTGCVLNGGPMYFWKGLPTDAPLTPGPLGSNSDPATEVTDTTESGEAEDLEELKLLVRVYGTVKNKSGKKAYVKHKKGPDEYRVTEYAGDRNAFFGSRATYKTFLKESAEELDANKERLRRVIEPPKKVRKKHTDWKKAQNVFYAWVRKAYKKDLGESTDVPKLIKAQMSDKLKDALKQVKVDYGKNFRYGGFNPRPMKLNGYRLGTISEHGIGNAIDIESSKNAHIPTAIWTHILTYTGKTLPHGTRKSKWKTAPKELYDKIKEINDEFVKKVKQAVKDKKDAATKANASEKSTAEEKKEAAKILKDPLAAAVGADTKLKRIGYGFVKRWQNGFFDLPWKLVDELHDEGFNWGATFSHPDLHHFEL